VTFKVDQRHWRWHNSVDQRSAVTTCLSCIISEIFNATSNNRLKIWLNGHRRSFTMTRTTRQIMRILPAAYCMQKRSVRSHSHFCRAMLCINAEYVVMRCPSVCLSVTFVDSVETNNHIVNFVHNRLGTPSMFFHTKLHGNIPTGTPLP